MSDKGSLLPFRYRNKIYWRIPGGEVQFGLISHRLTVWFRGRRLL
jgi:hypothetical protein